MPSFLTELSTLPPTAETNLAKRIKNLVHDIVVSEKRKKRRRWRNRNGKVNNRIRRKFLQKAAQRRHRQRMQHQYG